MGKLSFGNGQAEDSSFLAQEVKFVEIPVEIHTKEIVEVPVEVKFVEIPVEIRTKEIVEVPVEVKVETIKEIIVQQPIIQIDETKLNELSKKFEDLSAVNNKAVIYANSRIEEIQDSIVLLQNKALVQQSANEALRNEVDAIKESKSLQDRMLEDDMQKYENSMKMLQTKIFQQNVFFGLITIVLIITSLVFIINQ
jgi:hypothetical protein